jgi:hypothetical protein
MVMGRPNITDAISDPLFKAGYAEIFDGMEDSVDRNWSEEERLAYRRGRAFGLVVLEAGEGKLPLFQGSMVHSRARSLLSLAFATGEVE